VKVQERYAPTFVTGALAVALLLAGTRWAAWLGVPPLFITDVLLLVGISHYFYTRAATYRFPVERPAAEAFTPRVLLLTLVFGWAVVRLLLGWRLDAMALRDAVPYLYAIVGIVAAFAVTSAPQESRRRTARLLVWALGFHAVWVAAASLFPELPSLLPAVAPEQQLHVFSLRHDVDTAFTGVFAGWLVTRILRSDKPLRFIVPFILTWVVILMTLSRAGLAAAAVATFLGFVASHRRGPANRRALAVVAAPVLVAATLLVLPHTNIGERVQGTFGASQTESAVGAAGTTQARNLAWQALWDYVQEDELRYWFGVGYGPDFMSDSGALVGLVGYTEGGDTIPRSPHNYWIGTVSRMGVVGLLLTGMLACAVLLTAWRQLRRPIVEDELGVLVGLIAVSLLPVATFGVALESPFGAVPYFWAAGVLFAYPRSSSALHHAESSATQRPPRPKRAAALPLPQVRHSEDTV
jgi:O-antigen ligase